MKGNFLLATLSLGLILGGCASMNKDECLTANWQDIGHEDGLKGESRNRIGDHRKACAEHKVTPDSRAYFEGYEQGIRSFCMPSNGITVGLNGRSYHPQSCPPDMEPAFLTQYNYGRKLYLIRNDITNTRNEINRKEAALEKEQNAKARESLRYEISSLDRRMRTLESDEGMLRANPPQY